MKPFNLQAALAGAPVQTRDGRPVTQLHLFEADTPYPLYGVVGASLLQAWGKSGRWCRADTSFSDLFMAPRTMQQWVRAISTEPFYDAAAWQWRRQPEITYRIVAKGEVPNWKVDEGHYLGDPVLLREWEEE